MMNHERKGPPRNSAVFSLKAALYTAAGVDVLLGLYWVAINLLIPTNPACNENPSNATNPSNASQMTTLTAGNNTHNHPNMGLLSSINIKFIFIVIPIATIATMVLYVRGRRNRHNHLFISGAGFDIYSAAEDHGSDAKLTRIQQCFSLVFLACNVYYCVKNYLPMGDQAQENNLLPGDGYALTKFLNENAGIIGMSYNIFLNQWYLYKLFKEHNKSGESLPITKYAVPTIIAGLTSLPFIFLTYENPANDKLNKFSKYRIGVCAALVYTILNLLACKELVKFIRESWRKLYMADSWSELRPKPEMKKWPTYALAILGPACALVTVLNAYFTAAVNPCLTKTFAKGTSCNDPRAQAITMLFFAPFAYLVCEAIYSILNGFKKSIVTLCTTGLAYIKENKAYCLFNASFCLFKAAFYFMAYASAGSALDLLRDIKFDNAVITGITLVITALFNGSGFAGFFDTMLVEPLTKRCFPKEAGQGGSDQAPLLSGAGHFPNYGTSMTALN